MSYFSRSDTVSTKLSKLFELMGWVTFVTDISVLLPHFWGYLAKAEWMIRMTGSVTFSALILGLEYAGMAILFQPRLLVDFMNEGKGKSEVSNIIGTVGIIGFFGIVCIAYFYDRNVTLASYRASVNWDLQIMATISCIISEIFFVIANILRMSAKDKAQDNRRKNMTFGD